MMRLIYYNESEIRKLFARVFSHAQSLNHRNDEIVTVYVPRIALDESYRRRWTKLIYAFAPLIRQKLFMNYDERFAFHLRRYRESGRSFALSARETQNAVTLVRTQSLFLMRAQSTYKVYICV
jgi:hypothetical protein